MNEKILYYDVGTLQVIRDVHLFEDSYSELSSNLISLNCFDN